MVLGKVLKKLQRFSRDHDVSSVPAAELAHEGESSSSIFGGITFVNLVIAFVAFRILQRLYYFARGHKQLLSFNPRKALERWFKEEGVKVTNHNVQSSRDAVLLAYRRIGNGKRLVLLANGVGTALYMWLPIFSFLLNLHPKLFEGEYGITLIAPCYRGLFGSCTTAESKVMIEEKKIERSLESVVDPQYEQEEVDVTMKNCAGDVADILAHVIEHGPELGYNYKKEEEDPADVHPFTDVGEDHDYFEMVIGWSMGAQCILTCLLDHPFIAKKLFLLNPSSGRSLHTAFQAVAPMPFFLNQIVASLWRYLLTQVLRPSIRTSVWVVLKSAADSSMMRIFLEFLSFWGGFPPEQASYFHAYLIDVFATREQTRGLLDLIVALDSPLESSNGTCGGYGYFARQKDTFGGKSEQSVIVSGLPDFMTGIFHADILAANMNNRTRHKVYTMASHFLLLEWPDMVARDILELLDDGYDAFLRRAPGRNSSRPAAAAGGSGGGSAPNSPTTTPTTTTTDSESKSEGGKKRKVE